VKKPHADSGCILQTNVCRVFKGRESLIVYSVALRSLAYLPLAEGC
jgi:hypothetical protein